MVRGMPRAWLAAPIASAVACSSGAGRPPPPRPPSPAAPLLAVPRGETPAIDGVVDHAEWAGAAVVTLGQGANLRVMHDGASVYLALSGLDVPDAMAFACVFVADPDRVAVHHASAKLGSAAYTPDATGAYQPAAKTYEWRDPDAMLREEGWTASTVGPDRKQQELALAFARLGLPGEPRPIALGYVYFPPDTEVADAGVLTWPLGLADGVANAELLAGFNPDGVRFDPSRWIRLRID
jgi:hypothetical protein